MKQSMRSIRTQLVAEAIANYIKVHNLGADPKVFDAFHEELNDHDAHVVSWESGDEDWVQDFKHSESSIAEYARFMGTWLEGVNHYTLAVFQLDEVDERPLWNSEMYPLHGNATKHIPAEDDGAYSDRKGVERLDRAITEYFEDTRSTRDATAWDATDAPADGPQEPELLESESTASKLSRWRKDVDETYQQ